jgi:hypothetical protein
MLKENFNLKQKEDLKNRLSLHSIRYFSREGQVPTRVKPLDKTNSSRSDMNEDSVKKMKRYSSETNNEGGFMLTTFFSAQKNNPKKEKNSFSERN